MGSREFPISSEVLGGYQELRGGQAALPGCI